MAVSAAPLVARCSTATMRRTVAGGLPAPPSVLRRRSLCPSQPLPRRVYSTAGRPQPRAIRLQAADGDAGSWLDDGIEARPPVAPDPSLFGSDLAPVPAGERTFGTWDMTGGPGRLPPGHGHRLAIRLAALNASAGACMPAHRLVEQFRRARPAATLRGPAPLQRCGSASWCRSAAGSWREAWWSWVRRCRRAAGRSSRPWGSPHSHPLRCGRAAVQPTPAARRRRLPPLAGMSWSQGIACILLANALVLLPMVLIGHAGVKYGVPFPVLARSSFGVRGAVLPAVLRGGAAGSRMACPWAWAAARGACSLPRALSAARREGTLQGLPVPLGPAPTPSLLHAGLVAAGWFGLNTWLGGAAIHQMLQTLGVLGGTGPVISWLGITAAQVTGTLREDGNAESVPAAACLLHLTWAGCAMAPAWGGAHVCLGPAARPDRPAPLFRRRRAAGRLLPCVLGDAARGAAQGHGGHPPAGEVQVAGRAVVAAWAAREVAARPAWCARDSLPPPSFRLLQQHACMPCLWPASCSAPVLIGLTAALLGWAVRAAGGFGPMLAAPSSLQPGNFWPVFIASLSPQIGCAGLPWRELKGARAVRGTGSRSEPWRRGCCSGPSLAPAPAGPSPPCRAATGPPSPSTSPTSLAGRGASGRRWWARPSACPSFRRPSASQGWR